MARFVILEHDHPHLHWDLMLEVGERLRTWRLAAPPDPGTTPISATPLADHRNHYLDYEGPLSGNRGSVLRWDSGTYHLTAAASEDRLDFELHGRRLGGQYSLVRVNGAEWVLIAKFSGEKDCCHH